MVDVVENYLLKDFNTFRLPVKARYFTTLTDIAGFHDLVASEKYEKVLILGGGSNILFTKDFDGLVIHNQLKGIEVVDENEEFVWITAKAGEVWHDLVRFCVGKNWGGIENLSLIPGSVGAAPIQNIGAYGVELTDVFDHLEAVHISTGELHLFTCEDCRFAYRSSIFKQDFKGKYLISSVTLKLNKQPRFHLEYGDVQRKLEQLGYDIPTVSAVSEAICQIRNSKLPNPTELGNCGSFFKNPEISPDLFGQLQTANPGIPNFSAPNGLIKIPAAWLIEQCGFKGKSMGNTGTYVHHALVIVNYGKASGEEIRDFALLMQKTVQNRFGILLEPEVNIL